MGKTNPLDIFTKNFNEIRTKFNKFKEKLKIFCNNYVKEILIYGFILNFTYCVIKNDLINIVNPFNWFMFGLLYYFIYYEFPQWLVRVRTAIR